MAYDAAKFKYNTSPDIADLAGGATLADVIAKVNAILAALRAAGIVGGV